MEDFFTCYCLPVLYAVGLSASFFLIAYIAYRITYATCLKIFKKECLFKEIIIRIKRAILLIYLEVAAFMAFVLLSFNTLPLVRHVLIVVFIITIGYLLACLAKALYYYGKRRYATEELDQIEMRSMLTQIHFVYRLGMFAIIVLTFSAILLSFPHVKSIGIGLLGSAGIAGIALGIAARPILLNLMAGLQIALTKTIKIGDGIIVEGDFAKVEDIHLTHLVAKTWDMRRVIMPISYFIDHPFQNWSTNSAELLGTVFLHCDYSVPVDALRSKFEALLKESPYYNGNTSALHVTEADDKTIALRLVMTAKDAPSAFQLRAFIREKMIAFIQKEYPEALPKLRITGKTV